MSLLPVKAFSLWRWIIILVALDQLSRAWVRTNMAAGGQIHVLGAWFSIHFIPNTKGFSWFMPELPHWVSRVYILLLAAIAAAAWPAWRYYERRYRLDGWAQAAFVTLTAACCGHVAEAMLVPYTTDFLQILDSPCANFADVYAHVGLVFLVIAMIKLKGRIRRDAQASRRTGM